MRSKNRLSYFSDAKVIEVFNDSGSVVEMLRYFGYSSYGRSSDTLRKRCESLNLDFQSKIDQGRKYGRNKRRQYTNEEMFQSNSLISRGVVRKRILKNNLIPYICSICNLSPMWLGKPLTLILDHINGKCNDHRIENLRFVCGNCNLQLNTYGSRNYKNTEILV